MKSQAIKKIITFNNQAGQSIQMPTVVPAMRHSFDDWNKLPLDKILNVVITGSRETGINYHQQLFAIINYTYENFNEYKYNFQTSELFRKWLFIQIEFVDVVKYNNEIIKMPRSIAFEEIDQIAFMDEVYNPALHYCAGALLMSRDDLVNASIQYSFNIKLLKGKG